MAVVERRHQADVAREQHAVAEHVARHVADAGDAELLALRVDAELAEMALHRLPGAARGDRHLLVVVARRAARGERVAEPEAVLLRDGVGVVGESRRALVGGDHEVGVVAVVAHHALRRHHLAADQVVGDVEQPAQEGLVAGDAFFEERLALRRRPLHHEAALGADRDDHHVLHHLRLHQAEDLGAEVFHAVRPAQAAARHAPAAQVHAFDARRIDPDLEHRARLGQPRHALRVELERHVRLVQEIVGPRRGLDHREEAPQDAVLVQVLHFIERRGDLIGQLRCVTFTPKTGEEQAHQQRGDARVHGERLLDVGEAEGRGALPQVARVGAQHADLARRESRREHQAIEVVGFDRAGKHAEERVVEGVAHFRDLHLGAGGRHQAEIDHARRLGAGGDDGVRMLVLHAHAEALEHRHAVGERHAAAAAVDLEVEHAGPAALADVQVRAEVGGRVERLDHLDVGERLAHRVFLAIARGKRGCVDAKQFIPARFPVPLDERGVQVVLPAAHRPDQARLERLEIRRSRHLARPRADAHEDAAERGRREIDVEIRGHAVERLGEDPLEALAQLAVEALARHEDEAGHEAAVRVLAREQAQPRALAELQDRRGMAVEIVGPDLQKLVARIGLEDRGERLAAVARGQQPGALHDRGELAAQERHFARVCGVGGVGVKAEEARLAAHLALGVELLDADVVEMAGPVHGRARARLGEHQQLLHPRALARFGRQRGEARGYRLAGAFAQDAEPAAGDDAQHVLAAGGRDLVVAAAEEGEVVLEQPREERASFLELGLRRAGARRLHAREHVEHARLHRLPVLDRGAHIGQHLGDARFELGQLRRIGLAVDLQMHERFQPAFWRSIGSGYGDDLALAVALDAQHRVHQEVQRQPLAVHLHRHRVDQEGHVVVDDLDHGMRARPAVLLAHRVVHADPYLARRKGLAERQMGGGRPLQVRGRARGKLLGIDLGVIQAPERLDEV